ncbi:MAG: hypothetical protein KatS3mg012_2022 [Gaiellaceae bacterium]|nr:MAG: hypothetical protein KatS3mg012_2022 [Gaiellaceae bacterium]
MTRVAQLLAIAALAALSAACGGSGGTGATAGEPISFEQLSQAASTSAEATSGRFSFTLEVSSPELEQELGFSGEGAFDATAERSSFSADLSSFMALLGGLFAGVSGGDGPDFDDPSLWTIEIVRDGSQTFMKLPAIASKLPDGKVWVRVEDGELVEAAGLKLQEFDRFTGADPKQLLDVLRELSGEIEVVGREALRGVETTHYRATVDAESIAKSASKETGDDLGDLTDRLVGQSGLSEVPIDVWIDGDGILRKVVLDVEATQPGSSAPSRALLGFELWDLGEPVTIELPPSSEVVDVTRLER